MNNSFRLSRIAAPRATLWSIILLTLVLCIFGLSARAAMPANAAVPASHQLITSELIASFSIDRSGPLAQLLRLVSRG